MIMLIFAIIWAIGAIVTFIVSVMMMAEVYSYVTIIAWCVFAWPLYLVISIVTAINNP